MTSSSGATPRFSASTDTAAAHAALAPLITPGGGRWRLTADGEGLERTFKFKTFAKTWDFMTAVSLQCKIRNHHPEWSNVFNTTFIRWTTHNPKGLSQKDLDLAAACDALAAQFGEDVTAAAAAATPAPQPEKSGSPSCELAGLADRAVGSAGDCCSGKK